MAVSLTYEKGRFVRAVTRGNGIEGDDITANALTIHAAPRAGGGRATVRPAMEIRGEIYLTVAEFGGSTRPARRKGSSRLRIRET